MKKLHQKEHDFSAKLRQTSVIEHLKEYIAWQQKSVQEPAKTC